MLKRKNMNLGENLYDIIIEADNPMRKAAEEDP